MNRKTPLIILTFVILSLGVFTLVNAPPPILSSVAIEAVESSRMALAVVRQPINIDGEVAFLIGLDAPDVTVPLNSRIRLLVYISKVSEPQVVPFSQVNLRVTKVSLGVNGRSVEVSVNIEEHSPTILVYSLSGFPLTKKGNNAIILNVDYQFVGSLGFLHIPISRGTTTLRYGIDVR